MERGHELWNYLCKKSGSPTKESRLPPRRQRKQGRHGLGCLISSNSWNLGAEPAKAVQLQKGASGSCCSTMTNPTLGLPHSVQTPLRPQEGRSDVRRKRILVTMKVKLILFSNGRILQEGLYPCRNNGKIATQNEPISVLKNIFSRNFLSHDYISTTQ